MKKRAFICGYFNFPRGSAGANYVQYLSSALLEIGYDIVIISNINKKELNKKDTFISKNKFITIHPLELRQKRILHYVDFNMRLGNIVKRILQSYNLNDNDIIISYSTNVSINRALIQFARKNKIKSCACIVEWFSHEQFSHAYFNPGYYQYEYNFYKLFSKFDYIFAISHFIEKYYQRLSCKTLCLPIMADPYEYTYSPKSIGKVKKIIYPANGMIKESIQNVLEALDMLQDNDIRGIEFHICGVDKEKIKSILPGRLLKLIGNNIIIHKWMDYDDLIRLYQDMNFLFLAREINQMTLANFPSKVPETMCYGVIPVVSRVGDYTQYYLNDGENSIIFEGESKGACFNAIKRIINMTPEEMSVYSNAARETVIKYFYYHVWSKKIEYFLENEG